MAWILTQMYVIYKTYWKTQDVIGQHLEQRPKTVGEVGGYTHMGIAMKNNCPQKTDGYISIGIQRNLGIKLLFYICIARVLLFR